MQSWFGISWPSGVQWEWAIGEFAVLGFLVWELYSLRRTQRRDRQKAAEAGRGPAETDKAGPL